MCVGARGVAALRTLGLSRTASAEEVKAAFRTAAKKWHPDKHPGNSKSQAEERFKEVQDAYQLLSAPGGLRAAVSAEYSGSGGGGGGSGGPGTAGYRTSHARRGRGA